MAHIITDRHILFGVMGTNVPNTTEKQVEDQLLGGCFPIILIFFLMVATCSYTFFILI